jgi:3-mercaptopyruvate sulfurtransferase SseA
VVSLKTRGIQNAVALLGGFQAWKDAGKPVQKKETVASQEQK